MACSPPMRAKPRYNPTQSLRWSNKLTINKANSFGNHLRIIDDEDTRSVVATRSSAFSRATISKDFPEETMD